MAKNPNKRTNCLVCNKLFTGKYSSKKKYCGYLCFGLDLSEKKKKPLYQCLLCKKEFKSYPSQKRIYCSYECHIKSGGAWRAGLAAKEKILKYGAKKDANHNEVVEAIKKAGASVIDMSHVGRGFPDLIVGFNSQTLLVEIKNPKTSYGRQGLNKNQLKWKESWTGGSYVIVDGPEAALRMIGVIK